MLVDRRIATGPAAVRRGLAVSLGDGTTAADEKWGLMAMAGTVGENSARSWV